MVRPPSDEKIKEERLAGSEGDDDPYAANQRG